MEIQDLLNNISKMVQSYEDNLDLEDAFIKTSGSKLANEIYDVLQSYGFDKSYYEGLLNDIVESHLFYAHKANKNKYVNDNEQSIRNIRRIAQISIEEKQSGIDIEHSINNYRDDIDKISDIGKLQNNIDQAYADMIADLKRRFRVDNDDLWYEINKKLSLSKEKVVNELREYRGQNMVILHSIEEIVKGIGLQNNKYEQGFSQIDQIENIQHQKNDERMVKHSQEITTMFNYQFTELINEALSLISSNGINPNDANELKLQVLNTILPDFNRNYKILFDNINNKLIPVLIKKSKSLIENGKEVDLKNNKEVLNERVNIITNGFNSGIFGMDLNSFDDDTDLTITNIITKKYSINYGDPKYNQVYKMVAKKLESMKSYAKNFKNHLIDENIQEIEQMSNAAVMGKSENISSRTTLASFFK